jgi:hypothetical protein
VSILPPVPDRVISNGNNLTPPWEAWFRQLYNYLTASVAGGGAGIVTSTTNENVSQLLAMSDIEEPETPMPMFGSFQAGAAGLNLQVQYNSGGFLAGSANFTFDGTTATVNALTVTNAITLTAGTANQVQYLNASKVLTGSVNLTFDGTTLTAAGFAGPHNGTVGAGTPNTGAFTTLSASSTVSGTGFTNYFASPPSIGSTAAGSGAFTTLSASSTVSGTGFSTYLASPPAIGSTAASTGAFTTLSASSTFTLSGGTANGVGYLNGSKVFTTGAALTFDGTNFATTGTASATKFIPTGGSATGNGMYLPAANTLAFSVNGVEGYRLTTSGMLVGTTAAGGSMSNTATVLGGSFSTFTGSTSLPAATATTIATIPSGTRSSYLVTISLNVVDAINYGAAAIIVVDNSSASLATIKTGALMTLTMSGLNIQATSGAGTTNTGYWSVTRLNNQ